MNYFLEMENDSLSFNFYCEYFFSIFYNIVSIFIASSYVGGCSSIQYLGGESIFPSSRTDSFFPALGIQICNILSVIITRIIVINRNIKDPITEFSANVVSLVI